MDYFKDIINKLGNILLVITLVIFGLIHFKHDQLVIKYDLVQFGQKLLTYNMAP